MNRDPSTFRAADDATWGDPLAEQRRFKLPELIKADWVRTGQPDLVASIAQHPQILRDRSVLLNLAIEEYKERSDDASELDLHGYCERFHRFGSSIQQSILRQLETQRYLDAHPELLELFGEPVWPELREPFGDFLVLEELGRGAIARVYLCRQSELGNRAVVVKATPFSSAEAHVLGRLNHPNIIPIHSIGQVPEHSLNYLCMPFCGRSTLVDVLELAFAGELPRHGDVVLRAARRWTTRADELAHNGHVRPQRRASCGTYVGAVMALGIDIAEALDHAHQQSILHGDIKPSNILLTPDGRPLLMDFNLSVDFTDSVGLRGGTLPYMPPEHLQQLQTRSAATTEPEKFDARCDIYSFGALLYELLGGVTPIPMPASLDDPAAAAARALQQQRAGIPPLRELNPLVSPSLERKIHRCLAFDSKDRPATMAEVKRGLEEEMRLAPSASRRVRTRPRKYAAIVAVAVAIGGIGGTYWATKPPRHEAEFQRGQQAYADGDYTTATDHYAAAVAAAPELIPAKFELARAKLAAGEIDAARKEFQQLAHRHGDAQSIAHAGYCFNLQGLPLPAQERYEKLLAKGINSVAISNNLGASYLASRGRLSMSDSIAQAETLLKQALELDSGSTSVRLNLVRLEVAKASDNVAYSPLAARRNVEAVLTAAPENRFVQSLIGKWRELIIDRSPHIDPDLEALLTRIAQRPHSLPPTDTSSAHDSRIYYIEPAAR
ncbi:MAG: protein kinase [Pirellulales bacterium]